MSQILLGGTQSNLAGLKSLYHSPIVNGQCRKRWSIDSPFPLHKTHHSGQRDLSLVFTFLCATNQARALTFEGAFDLPKNLAKRNKTRFEKLDKTKKKKI